MKITLPDSGLEMEVKSLSWDEAEEFLELQEKVAQEGTVFGRKVLRETLESLYGPVIFEEIKGSNRDVNYLYNRTTTYTFGLPEEIKN